MTVSDDQPALCKAGIILSSPPSEGKVIHLNYLLSYTVCQALDWCYYNSEYKLTLIYKAIHKLM